MRYPNNLKSLQTAKGWTIDQAAEAMGISRGGYLKIQRGENRLTSTTLETAARAFGVSAAEVLGSPDPMMVPIVGLVSAGSDSIGFAHGDGNLGEVEPPPDATPQTVAVEVRGTSLGDLLDGSVLFYDDVHNPPSSAHIGRLCVVGLSDGRVVVKSLHKGQLPDRWTLKANVGQPIYDAEVVWAARVNLIRPPR